MGDLLHQVYREGQNLLRGNLVGLEWYFRLAAGRRIAWLTPLRSVGHVARTMGITQSIKRAAQQNPGGYAIVFGTRTRRWTEFVERVGCLASGLHSLGISAGDRVASLPGSGHAPR